MMNTFYKSFFLLIMPILILHGCGGELKVPQRVCEGKKNVAESLYSLRLHSLSPFRANGQCHLQYDNLYAYLYEDEQMEFPF